MAFMLPPTSAPPPNFNGGGYTAQPQQQPMTQQQLLQSTQAVQPLQQPAQQQTAPVAMSPLQTAMQQYPSPTLSGYLGTQNTGGMNVAPQPGGLANRVAPMRMTGAVPQFGRMAFGVRAN